MYYNRTVRLLLVLKKIDKKLSLFLICFPKRFLSEINSENNKNDNFAERKYLLLLLLFSLFRKFEFLQFLALIQLRIEFIILRFHRVMKNISLV